jgi:dipeptidyl aminopeptidase/acylaminoacyl peptidase
MARPVFRLYSADGQPLAEAVTVAGARRLGGIDWHRGTDTLLLFGLDDQDRPTIWTTSVDGQDLKPVHVGGDHVVAARWSPLASTIYFLRARAETADLVSIDVARTDSLRVLATGLPNGNQLSVSTDGRRLLHLRGITRSNLAVIDAGGTDPIPRPMTRGTAIFDQPAVSPDGRWIAAVAGEGAVTSIVKIPREGGNPVRLTDGQGRDRSPAWSPDGRHLAFGSRRNGENGVWVMDDDGRNVRKLERTNAAETPGVAWTPDGRVMWQQNTAAKGITYRVRDLSTGNEEFLVEDSEGFFVSRAVFSPTADAVAFRWGRVPFTQSGIWLLRFTRHSMSSAPRRVRLDAMAHGCGPTPQADDADVVERRRTYGQRRKPRENSLTVREAVYDGVFTP